MPARLGIKLEKAVAVQLGVERHPADSEIFRCSLAVVVVSSESACDDPGLRIVSRGCQGSRSSR